MNDAGEPRRDDDGRQSNPSRAQMPRHRRRRSASDRTMMRKGLAAMAAAVLGLTGVMAATTPAVAVTDENPEFRLNKADLDFILRQIQISESHAAGNPLLCESPSDTSWTCVPDPKLAYGLRTVDGSYNNLMPVSRSNWSPAVAQLIDLPASIDLWFDTLSYNSATDMVSATVKAAVLNAIPAPQNLTIYLTEAPIIDGQEAGSHPWGQQHIENYEHRHVLRAALNSPWGEAFISADAQRRRCWTHRPQGRSCPC